MKTLRLLICTILPALCLSCGESAQVIKQSDLEKNLPGKWVLEKQTDRDGRLLDVLTAEKEVVTYDEAHEDAMSHRSAVTPLEFGAGYRYNLDGKKILEKKVAMPTLTIESTVGYIRADKLVVSVVEKDQTSSTDPIIKEFRRVKIDLENDVVGQWICTDATDEEKIGCRLDLNADGTFCAYYRNVGTFQVQAGQNKKEWIEFITDGSYFVDGNLAALSYKDASGVTGLNACEIDVSKDGNRLSAFSVSEEGTSFIELERM